VGILYICYNKSI